MLQGSMCLPLLVLLVCLAHSAACPGETISLGAGEARFDVEFVPIGSPGNQGDAVRDGMGSVEYPFRIGKFEVSCSQYETAGKAGALGQWPWGDEFCSVVGGVNIPVHVMFGDALLFANWLNTSQGYPPAYQVDRQSQSQILWPEGSAGYDPNNPYRNALAKYALPTTDEWHKAAFYDSETATYNMYSTGDSVPENVSDHGGVLPNTARFRGDYVDVHLAGGLSAFGTMGQGGNIPEFEETPWVPQFRGPAVRSQAGLTPLTRRRAAISHQGGMRIVVVPEPKGAGLLGFAGLLALAHRRRAPWPSVVDNRWHPGVLAIIPDGP